MDAKAVNQAAGADEANEVIDTNSESAAGQESLEELLAAGLAGDDAGTDDLPPGDDPGDGAEAQADEAGATDEDEEQIKEGEIEGLGAKAQAKVNARIHELNVRRKNAEAEAAELKERQAELDAKLQNEHVQAVMKAGIDPDYVTADEAKTLQRFETLRSWRSWLRAHRDGYEGAGTRDDPTFTPEQIAAREAQVEDELLDVAGPARSLWTERAKQMRADMALGRKLRLARGKAGAKKLPQPPRIPAKAGAAGANRPPVSTAGRREKAVFDSSEFETEGADKSALEKQFEKIFGGG